MTHRRYQEGIVIEISPSLDKLQVLVTIRGACSGIFHLMEKAKGNLIFVRPLGKHPHVRAVVIFTL